jgi:phage tail protein X
MPVGDPARHHERYAHLPVINREGSVLAFCYHRYAFVERCPDASCEANKAVADFV